MGDPDIYADDRIPQEAYGPTFVKSLAMVPIRRLDPVGAIGNYWADLHEPSEREVALLQALADSTAVALEHVRVLGELDAARREGLERLALAAEYRDDGTREHPARVGYTSLRLAQVLGMDDHQASLIGQAAALHDVGKLAIPDAVLHKPGPLDESEWRLMRQHPVIGERILSEDPDLQPVARLVRSSHERWDGHGYPDRLAGTEIPKGARIIAACDAFDAMTSDRCYQPARSLTAAIEELHRCAGTQFDPDVVAALCRRLEGAEPVAEPLSPIARGSLPQVAAEPLSPGSAGGAFAPTATA